MSCDVGRQRSGVKSSYKKERPTVVWTYIDLMPEQGGRPRGNAAKVKEVDRQGRSRTLTHQAHDPPLTFVRGHQMPSHVFEPIIAMYAMH